MKFENNQMKNKSKITLIFFASIMAGLLLAEFYIRAHNPYLITEETERPQSIVDESADQYTRLAIYTQRGKRLIPNSHVTYINKTGEYPTVRIDINSHGFRDEEIPLRKSNGERRMLVLGDSITMAMDSPLELTYVGRMETSLRRMLPNEKINVINGGIDGIGFKDELDILEDNGLNLDPDIVMVQFYLNDSRPPDQFGALLANPGWIRQHSILAEVIYRNYQKRKWLKNYSSTPPEYVWTEAPVQPTLYTNRQEFLDYAEKARLDWGAAWQEDSWELIEQQLERLAEFSRKNSFTPIIVAFPVSFQVYAQFLENTPQQRLAELCREQNFAYFDLLPALREARKYRRPIFSDHCHLTGFGHQVVADILTQMILNTNLLQ